MWLKRIELKNFKRFSDFLAQFSPGINVVKGPLNEMGKSTLLEGVIVAFFGNPKSTARELRGYVSWGSTGQFRTSLEFEERGNRYLLEKDFDKGTARLVDDRTQQEFDTFREISQKVAELLGTGSDTLFSCSSCIRQSEVSEISSGKKEISESLEEVVTGGKESTLASQVIRKLDDKISEMRKGLDRPARIPGSLARLNNDVRGISRRYGEVKDEVSGLEAQKIQLLEVDKRLTEVKEEYEKCHAWLEKNKQCKDIEASIERLTKEYDDVAGLLNRIKNQEGDCKKADEALGTIAGLKDKQQVSRIRMGLEAIRNRRGDIEQDLATRDAELAEASQRLGRRKLIGMLGSRRGTAVSVAILVGGLIGFLVGHFYLLSLLVLGGALLAASGWARTTLVRDKTTISGIEERVRKMRGSLDELSQRDQELLAEARCNTMVEFDAKERDFYYWLEKRRKAEYVLAGMLTGETIQDIEKRRQDLARKLAVEQARLTEDLVETRLSPEQYVELERKVQALEVTSNELEDRKRDGMAILKAARYDAEEQVRLEEELERLHKALEHEERKGKVFGLAREFIARARSEVLSSVEEALEKQIETYLTVFTDGKYGQVEVNKETLEFGLYSDEKGDWVKPEDLSGGVIDEFYLAFRLALAKLIFGDKKPPLILDDPFVNFDSVRLGNTLDFLRTLASDYQIIIFTLGDSYDKVADNIILLGEDVEPPTA
jgi:DNA repair exonuclease SbcCD ATPase subunit